MTSINKETALAVLRIVRGQGEKPGPIATHWMNPAFFGQTQVRYPTQRTRLFLHTLREAGLVEGHLGRDGGTRWWSITDAGQQFLNRNTIGTNP